MSRIVILESLGVSFEKMERLKKPLIEAGHDFIEYTRTMNNEKLKEELHGADAAILANMPLCDAVIRSANKLKYIDVAFTGVDHIGMQACKEKDIHISNASGYSDEAVAELAIGMSLALLRNIREAEKRCRTAGTKDGLVGSEIKGKTVGIIGMGRIGTRSAELFHAFGANVIGVTGHHRADDHGYIEYYSESELLQLADIVVLHCPLNESTKNLVNLAKLKRMKSTAILINLARGAVVNTSDLVEALQGGLIAGAGIDVFDAEPPLDQDLPIMHAPNTLLTPHIAYASKESLELRAEIVFDNLTQWLKGKIVNQVL